MLDLGDSQSLIRTNLYCLNAADGSTCPLGGGVDPDMASESGPPEETEERQQHGN